MKKVLCFVMILSIALSMLLFATVALAEDQKTIGVDLYYRRDEYYVDLESTFTTYGEEQGYIMNIQDADGDVAKQIQQVEDFITAGVDAIVIPNRGSALINGDAMKTSAGALSLINVCRVENMKDAIDFLKASGLRLVGFTEKAKESLWQADLTGPLCVVMGSEEDGISPAYIPRLDGLLMIPMPGDIDSLNVSVATGVVCFEVVRQRMG